MDVVTYGHEPAGEPAGGPQHMVKMVSHRRPTLAAADGDGILKRLLRRKFLFAGVFAVTAALALGAYCILPATYKAEALVTVTASDRLLGAPGEDKDSTTIGDAADLESQSEILLLTQAAA